MRRLILSAAAAIACVWLHDVAGKNDPGRMNMDLSGDWQSSLGICRLPGTTDESRLGPGNDDWNLTSALTRSYPFAGQVVYERDIYLPADMASKKLSLIMERTKPCTLWVDGDSIDHIGLLCSPHRYSLPSLSAGRHHIRIVIDNSDSVVPEAVRGSHAWTDATQTNWNGVLGRFAIEATDKSYISDMQLKADPRTRLLTTDLEICVDEAGQYQLSVTAADINKDTMVHLNRGVSNVVVDIPLNEKVESWSEFHPSLYKVTATLSGKGCHDRVDGTFGMRDFSTSGTQFAVNGIKTFLRGTHDGCVFPLTGYCPTDIDEWRRVFRIAKEYGLNHFRFHSYTPTETAFRAADEAGVYLFAELPLWGTIDSTTVSQNEFLLREAKALLRSFGNHPSFVALGLGNELWGDTAIMRSMLDELRDIDSRRLYYMGANNDLGWHGPKNGEDFYVTCRVGGGEGTSTHVRSSFSFADAEEGGILNSSRPGTRRDYSYPVSLCKTPVVSHESGQFQIYPDYKELPKYTGVLRPRNLEIFRSRLQSNGLSSQADDFHGASGKWAVECYKADMEMCLRTPGFGGYQLLDLKDYPGQGTALVGILDAFMDSKGLVSPETFRGWSDAVTLMAQFDSYCLDVKDTLKADIVVANYLEHDYAGCVSWSITDGKGFDRSGSFVKTTVPQGGVVPIGSVTLPMDELNGTCKLRMTVTDGTHSNGYNLWVYKDADTPSNGYLIADTLDNRVVEELRGGGKVLLLPRHESILSASVGPLFTPDYWNYAMFKTISENNGKPVSPGTLGLLMDPAHPVFRLFPTDGRSDWQWWSVARNSRPLVLDALGKDYRPLIQAIDNVERNHKLGLLMEFKAGDGKLLVCTTDVAAIACYPEGRAFSSAIKNYILSDEFNPAYAISIEDLRELLYSSPQSGDLKIKGVRNITDYKKK